MEKEVSIFNDIIDISAAIESIAVDVIDGYANPKQAKVEILKGLEALKLKLTLIE